MFAGFSGYSKVRRIVTIRGKNYCGVVGKLLGAPNSVEKNRCFKLFKR